MRELHHRPLNPQIWEADGNIRSAGVLLVCSWTPAPNRLREKQSTVLQSRTPETSHLCEEGLTLQPDNEPKHTSKLCKNYLKTKAGLLTVRDFPPHWAFMGHLKREKVKHSRHEKRLFGTLSDHAGIVGSSVIPQFWGLSTRCQSRKKRGGTELEDV